MEKISSCEGAGGNALASHGGRANAPVGVNARKLEENAVELKTFPEQRRIAEAWHRGILHAAPDGMLVINERGTIALANAELARMFGYAEGELIGQPMELLIPDDLRHAHARMRMAAASSMREGQVRALSGNLRARRKDGSEFAAEVALSRLPSAVSHVGTICAAVRDITERKRMETALAASEAQHRENVNLLKAVIESSPDVIVFALDQDYRYLIFNEKHRQAIRTLWGRDIAPGISMLDIFGEHPDRDKARDGFARALAGESFVIEEAYGDEARVRRFLRIHCAPIRNEAGGILGLTCLSIDITERKRAEEKLAQREREFRSLAENVPDNVARWDTQGRYLFINPTHERTLGKSSAEAAGTPIPDSHDSVKAAIARVVVTGQAIHAVRQRTLVEGNVELHDVSMVPEFDEAGRVISVLGIGRNMTDIYQLQETLAAREREFRSLIENSPDTVARYGRDLRRLYVNPAFAALVEDGEAALIGRTPSECPGGPNAGIYERHLCDVFASGREREFDLTWIDKSGRERCSLIRLTPEFGNDGMVERILAIGRDITELNASRQKIHQMAFYDALTSLPNRALFNDRLRQMIADASWHGVCVGIMLIDLDHFKAINDTMGHATGDELLCEAAARLSNCVRAYDTVARLGGDEFAVLLPNIQHGDDLGRIASKILGKFDERFLLAGKEVFMSCSIGIAMYPDDSAEVHDLVSYADSAMYFAKRSGRNNFRFYSKDLTDSARERLTLESELRYAIVRGQFELFYQPKVQLENMTMIGSEALLRWRHPQLGMVPPDRFIRVAEDTGLIVEVGKWVLRQACCTSSEWNAGGKPLHKVAINLSARQFQTDDLVASVAAILEETVCRPEWIELEITESLLLEEDGKTLDTLTRLRAMGITIAIDDFGTGYSALSYLTRFPFDTLKIDRSFIQSVTTEKYHAELVKAILSIAHYLGQEVVAEGVETIEQAKFLTDHGCKVAQGYLYSKPLPKAGITSLPWQFSPVRAP
jgi:diguanylate cyclase (GGDEF)-like protein/PAS domain S-box-containing protein